MADGQRPMRVEIVWSSELRFGATSGNAAIGIDADGADGPSPVQLLGMALLGCVAADVVDILRKGRHPLTHFHAVLTAERAPDPPRRLRTIHMQFAIHGDVPATAVDRAIALSREKYCSVWHSLRDDIEIATAFDLHGPS